MQKYWLFYLIPLFFAVIGTITTIVISNDSDKNHLKSYQENFNNSVNTYTLLLQDEINNNINKLVELGKIYRLNPKPTREDFTEYTSEILERHQGIQALGWNIRVTDQNEREAIELDTQTFFSDPNKTFKGFYNGTVTTSPIESQYVIVRYIEPIKSNYDALLLDIGSNVARNVTINKAIKTKEMSSTEPITLVQENESQPGILVMYPVFNPVFDPPELLGFSVGVFRIGTLFKIVLDKVNVNIEPHKIRIYHQDDFVLLFKLTDQSKYFNQDEDIIENNSIFIEDTYLQVADSQWLIRFESNPLPPNDIGNLIIQVIPIFTVIIVLFSIILIKFMNMRFVRNLHSQQIELKNQFTNYIFHEVRVPLNTIVIGVENLKSIEMNEDDQEQLFVIEQSLQQTNHILNDILDINKIESGKFEINPEFVQLDNYIKTVCSSFNQIAKHKQITFSVNIHQKLINTEIYMDKNRITQCLNNYLSNAFKYTPDEGEIILAIKTYHSKLGQSLVEFSVQDNGYGISAANQLKLFQPYVQIYVENKSEVGTGLGLVITKQIAVLHGGSVWVTSKEEDGSTFYLTINTPIKEITVDKYDQMEMGELVKEYPSLSFLIVDDTVGNRFVLSKYLEKKGFKTDEAANGKIAVEKVKNNKYDLIFMDKNMPVMDGLEATRQIRKIDNQIPIIGLAGLATEKDKKEFMEIGLNKILIKPFNFDEFEKILQEYFHK